LFYIVTRVAERADNGLALSALGRGVLAGGTLLRRVSLLLLLWLELWWYFASQGLTSRRTGGYDHPGLSAVIRRDHEPLTISGADRNFDRYLELRDGATAAAQLVVGHRRVATAVATTVLAKVLARPKDGPAARRRLVCLAHTRQHEDVIAAFVEPRRLGSRSYKPLLLRGRRDGRRA
jgi:hypothetical protein